MAITRKPRATPGLGPVVDIDALIHKGGSVAGSEVPQRSERHAPVVLRSPADVLAQVDTAVQRRPVRIPRHTWIMEAIVEKLEREQAS
jgi:hypothetical protein